MAATPGTVDALIESASRRGNIPDAQMTYLTSDFLAMIEEELMAYALPILHSRRDDYYLEELMFKLEDAEVWIGGKSPSEVKHPGWRLPAYAMASTVRDVQGVSPSGTFYNLGRVQLDDVPNMVSQAWYFYGNYLVYQQNTISSTAPPVAIRCVVHVKPNSLITTTKDAVSGLPIVVDYASSTGNPNEYEIYFTEPVAGSYSGYVDFIRGTPGYEVYQRRIFMTLAPGATSIVRMFPDGTDCTFKHGDWISVIGTTPVIPLPLEMHALLAQRVVVKFLEAQGDASQLEQSRQSLQEMALQIPLLIQPRAEGKPKKLAPRLGLWRRWRW